MLTGTKLYDHLINIYAQAQDEIHAAYRRDLDEDQMNELARNAGRRLDCQVQNLSEQVIPRATQRGTHDNDGINK